MRAGTGAVSWSGSIGFRIRPRGFIRGRVCASTTGGMGWRSRSATGFRSSCRTAQSGSPGRGVRRFPAAKSCCWNRSAISDGSPADRPGRTGKSGNRLPRPVPEKIHFHWVRYPAPLGRLSKIPNLFFASRKTSSPAPAPCRSGAGGEAPRCLRRNPGYRVPWGAEVHSAAGGGVGL